MRVLILSTNYHPVIGGAESYCRDLAAGLADRGHSVTVFTDGSASREPSVQVERGVTVIRDCSCLAGMAAADVSAWEQMAFGLLPIVSSAVDLARVDVIHANSQDTALLGAVLKLQYGIPLVVTSHEVQRDRGPAGAGRCRLVFRHLPVDAHIAVSAYYEQIARSFGATGLHRIDLGVDLTRFSSGDAVAARDWLGIAADEVVVTCVARFKHRKGLLELIDAAADVTETVPRLRLVLAGTTSSGSTQYAGQMRVRLTERGIADRTLIVEGAGHDQIPAVLHATDVYVQPSHVEGLGLAVLEAMACGAPVVASDTDGLREVVEHEISGLLVPVGDSVAIAAAVRRLLRDRGLRQRLLAGGRRRAAGFGADRMVAQTEALYRHLVDGASARLTVDADQPGLVLMGEGRSR